MLSPTDPEPDQRPTIFQVGQDVAGHWLVQESGGRIEGRFVSQSAAMTFARSERHAFPGARVELANAPMTPLISFAPVQPWERAGRALPSLAQAVSR